MLSFHRSLSAVFILIGHMSLASCQSTTAFDKMANKMAKGKVTDLEVQDVMNNIDQYLVLDAREKQEYDISHIPGAIWVGFDDFNVARIPESEKPILVYCSVGYRSERIGEKLLDKKDNQVYNLRGSLFKWANEKLPMVDMQNNSTTNVHGFNRKWGKWVKEGQVVYE